MGNVLKEKMISVMAWSTIEKSGQHLLHLLASIVFARLLTPADFGVMGIIMIFVTLSIILVESGFGQALIRKTVITAEDYTSVFYFNLLTAVVLYLILFFTAPLIASFFHRDPLALLIRVMSLVIIINAFYLIPYAHLGRALDYRTISIVNLGAVAVGALAGIGVALLGHGVWALVVQQSVFHLLRWGLITRAVRWKPSGRFRFSIIRGLWGYSLRILASSLVNALFHNLFLIILGRTYTKAEAGQFAQGNKLAESVGFTFRAIFAGPTFALFSQLQDDLPRFGRVLGETIRRTALITIPVVGVLIAAAHPLITLLWTEKFQPAVIYFQLMGLASLLAPFHLMNINALNVRGRSGITLGMELINKALILIAIALLYHQGILYMIGAFVAGSLLAYPVSVWFVRRELGQPIRRQLANVAPGIAVGLAVGGAAAALNGLALPVVGTLALQLAVCVPLYFLLLRLFVRSLYDELLGQAGRHLHRVIRRRR